MWILRGKIEVLGILRYALNEVNALSVSCEAVSSAPHIRDSDCESAFLFGKLFPEVTENPACFRNAVDVFRICVGSVSAWFYAV